MYTAGRGQADPKYLQVDAFVKYFGPYESVKTSLGNIPPCPFLSVTKSVMWLSLSPTIA